MLAQASRCQAITCYSLQQSAIHDLPRMPGGVAVAHRQHGAPAAPVTHARERGEEAGKAGRLGCGSASRRLSSLGNPARYVGAM